MDGDVFLQRNICTTHSGLGKRGAYYLVRGDLPRQHSLGTTSRFSGHVPADSRL
ncbi:unnamed protein product [Ascophyllum nodosum]